MITFLMSPLFGLIYIVGAVLVYVGIVISLFVNPNTDDEEWTMLLFGLLLGLFWGPILIAGLIFGAIPEGCKALHAWIHRPKPEPAPAPVPPTPSSAVVPPQADKLTTVKA